MTNEQSTYKCDFEHTTLEQCGLYQDEVLEETCPEEFCTPSEFLKSLGELIEFSSKNLYN